MRSRLSGITVVLLFAGAIAFVVTTAWSQQAEREYSGFMEDYSILHSTKSEGPDLIYLPPGVEEHLAGYTKIMIDQPEIFLAPDSPHKGMKPDQLVESSFHCRCAFFR